MKSGVYEVTLNWHDGGSVFLGSVAAMSQGEAEVKALQNYIAQSNKQKREIEEGGGYQLDASPLPPDDWR